MASIKSALMLQDRMSPALRSVTSALGMVINNMQAMQSTATQKIDTRAFDTMRNECARASASFEEIADDVSRAANEQDKFNTNISKGSGHADGLMNKIKGIAATYVGMKGLSMLTELSDTMTSNRARLGLIVDDGGSVQALENKIFASAQSARASYTDVKATVAKLGLNAGKAFSGNDEIIKFQELVNKNFVIGGASAQEQTSAMYQLTQAMSAGKLQGDEYRSIIENAPLLAKSIEDYMHNIVGVEGSMKDWASEGMLTADVIKASVFGSMDQVEKRFNEIPMTWGQVWTKMKNTSIRLLDPVLRKISELVNSSKFQDFANKAVAAFGIVASAAVLVVSVIGWIIDQWNILQPIMIGGLVLVAFAWLTVGHEVMRAGQKATLTGLQMIQAGWQSFTAGIKAAAGWLVAHWQLVAIIAVITLLVIFWQRLGTVGQAVGIAVVITLVLIQLAAIGVTWPLLLIVGILLVVAAGFVFFGDIATQVLGAIVGGIYWLGATLWNIIVGVINAIIQFLWTYFVEPWIGIIEFVLNVFNGGFNSFGDGVKNLLGQIISWFLSLGKVVTKIIDAIFGTNWTDGLNSLQSSVLQWGKNENAVTLSREAPLALSRVSATGAFDAGYSAGTWLGNQATDAISNMKNNLSTMLNGAETQVQNPDTLFDPNGNLGNIAGDTSNMAGNLSDSMDKSDEQLEYLRDLAERESITRFTTAEVKIDMTGMTNRIDSDMDIDGVISALTDEFAASLATAAEGVHL